MKLYVTNNVDDRTWFGTQTEAIKFARQQRAYAKKHAPSEVEDIVVESVDLRTDKPAIVNMLNGFRSESSRERVWPKD